MDLMEQLLCPQISMDVDETPLELDTTKKDTTKDDKDGSVSEEDPEMPDHIKIQVLMENDRFDTSQTPETLTEEEETFKKNLFSQGPAVQFMKLHCTSCHVHLGSAPLKQLDRYIHPLLQVLMCKSCYNFYSSGDFDKDEDGSELYCRWCGQGGNVMCCSDCAFVFCQKCVRANLGKKALAEVKNSEDWRCLVCNPMQMMQLKVICQTLFEFTLKEIRRAKDARDTSILMTDYSLCCNRAKKQVKRKRTSSTDETYDPTAAVTDDNGIITKRKKDVLRKALTTFTPRAPTGQPQFRTILPAAGPNRVYRMPTNQILYPPGLAPLSRPNRLAAPNRAVGPNLVRFTRTPQPRGPILLCTTTNRPVTPAMVQNRAPVNVPARGSQNFIPLNNNNNPNSVRMMSSNQQSMVNSVPARIQSGMRHIWYDRASAITNDITQNLTRKISGYTIEQRNAKTVEELANVHNKLQELLSSSVNSLIQVRKSLRNEFLRDLNKLKQAPQRLNQPPPPPPPVLNNHDDDIIVIHNEENTLPIIHPVISEPKLLMTSPEITDGQPRTFLKVKPVSSLIDSSRLIEQPKPDVRITDNIDLCDDDEDDLPPMMMMEPIVSINENVGGPQMYVEPPLPDMPIASEDPNESEYDLPPVDEETYRQIQRALAESRFESLVQDNGKIKVNPLAELSTSAVKRMLSVRVIMAPNYKRALPKAVDFEEIINSSIVENEGAARLTSSSDDCVTVGDSDDESESGNGKSLEVSAISEKQGNENVIDLNDSDTNNRSEDIIDLDETAGQVLNNAELSEVSSEDDEVICTDEAPTCIEICDDDMDSGDDEVSTLNKEGGNESIIQNEVGSMEINDNLKTNTIEIIDDEMETSSDNHGVTSTINFEDDKETGVNCENEKECSVENEDEEETGVENEDEEETGVDSEGKKESNVDDKETSDKYESHKETSTEKAEEEKTSIENAGNKESKVDDKETSDTFENHKETSVEKAVEEETSIENEGNKESMVDDKETTNKFENHKETNVEKAVEEETSIENEGNKKTSVENEDEIETSLENDQQIPVENKSDEVSCIDKNDEEINTHNQEDNEDINNKDTSTENDELCSNKNTEKVDDIDDMESPVNNTTNEEACIINKTTTNKTIEDITTVDKETHNENIIQSNGETDEASVDATPSQADEAETNVDFKIMINEKRPSVDETVSNQLLNINPDAEMLSPPENLDDNALDPFDGSTPTDVFNIASDPVTTTDSGIEIDAK